MNIYEGALLIGCEVRIMFDVTRRGMIYISDIIM